MSSGGEKKKIAMYVNNNITETVTINKEMNIFIVASVESRVVTGVYALPLFNKHDMLELAKLVEEGTKGKEGISIGDWNAYNTAWSNNQSTSPKGDALLEHILDHGY